MSSAEIGVARLAVIAGLAIAANLATAAGYLLLHDAGRHTTTPVRTAGAVPAPTPAAVSAVLRRRSHAVIAHDRAAFLATIDPSGQVLAVTAVFSWREAEFVKAFGGDAQPAYPGRSPLERAILHVLAPHFLPLLYEWPEDMIKAKAYLRPENWPLVNPNWGASVDPVDFQRKFEEADAAGGESRRLFLAKRLNVPPSENMGGSWALAETLPR